MPRILVVDDERQIHASLRLRIGSDYDLAFCFSAREALDRIERERFDLCIADIHMPEMDGLTFVEEAQKTDPELGFIFLSAFDTDENLRRAIPLQVFDFIGKPLPDRDGFEDRIPGWIEQTRNRRHQRALAQHSKEMVQDLQSAQLEREVELVASESARDALLQTAGLLTTIHAHLLSSSTLLNQRAKSDPSLGHLLRSLEEARKTADAAILVTESFFDSAYGNRDTSPAVVNPGLRHAINIATRMSHAEEMHKTVDVTPASDEVIVREISGIDFLLMMVPAIGLALYTTAPETTVRVTTEHVARLENASRDSRYRQHLWINRRNALTSHAGVTITVTCGAAPLNRAVAEAWLKGASTPLPAITARGLVLGMQKAKGLLGIAVESSGEVFQLVLVLPT
ncbi:response regulator [Opitutus sp. ER46]|uniref:response regulator transcription factor n=1 Tax=Opitutus sp. ER46 TaxID=2161864 RepID=UPI00130491B1|nr:response regulator [Opitutus sp. ER46]